MQLHHFVRLGLTVWIVAACASGSEDRPSAPRQADVEVRTAGRPFFGSGTTAPLHLDVSVTNRAAVPMTVRAIRISSPGMMQYTVRPEQRIFSTTLAPGETKTFPISATLIAGSRRPSLTEPLDLRTDLDFETEGRRFREIFNVSNVGW